MFRTGYDQDLCNVVENQILKFVSLQQTYSTDSIWRTVATSNGDSPVYDNQNIFFSIATTEGDNLISLGLQRWGKLIVNKRVTLFPK